MKKPQEGNFMLYVVQKGSVKRVEQLYEMNDLLKVLIDELRKRDIILNP